MSKAVGYFYRDKPLVVRLKKGVPNGKSDAERQVISVDGRVVNLGGSYLDIKAVGADEALNQLNELTAKLKEANDLIQKLASMEVKISIGQFSEVSQ